MPIDGLYISPSSVQSAERSEVLRAERYHLGGDMVNFELMTRAKPMMPRENMLVGHAQNAKDLTRSLP